ncbi:MAG: type IV toxin-antitoxin system AbiEi family antitoxin domain-containing protein [Nitriliruptoraceae bacterium]
MEDERSAAAVRRSSTAVSPLPSQPGRTPAADPVARRDVALERLSRVARRQFGVVTTQQAQVAGVSRDSLATLVRSRVLVRRFRGVYAFRGTPDSREARWLAAQFAIGRRAVLSHRTAAAIHGLDHGAVEGAVHVIVPRRSRESPAGIVVHESPNLQVATAKRHGVLRVTSVPRTLCDLAGEIRDPDRMRRLVAAAVRSGDARIDQLREELERRRTFAGRALLRHVVAELSPLEPMAREELESLFLRITTAAGVPPTAMNHRVTDADGRTRYLDALWLPERVFAELDSRRFHGTLVDWHDDQRRENAVLLAGYGPCLRFSWWDLHHHATVVVDTLRRALAAAAAAAAAEAP